MGNYRRFVATKVGGYRCICSVARQGVLAHSLSIASPDRLLLVGMAQPRRWRLSSFCGPGGG